MQIPTYQDVIEQSRAYRRDKNDEALKIALKEAEEILRRGFEEHPYALPIGDELVLVLEKQGRDAEALTLLEELGRRFRDTGEETLCRFGKIHKNRAGRLAGAGGQAAIAALTEAEGYYGLAYEKSHGFYPRINQLSTRFLRAAAMRQSGDRPGSDVLVKQVQEQAREMLADSTLWQPRLADDHIWIPATCGEASFLGERWEGAEQYYQEALLQSAGSHFYATCMCGQVERLIKACQPLEIVPGGALADPKAFFGCQEPASHTSHSN